MIASSGVLMLSSSSVLRSDGPRCWSSRKRTSTAAMPRSRRRSRRSVRDLLVAFDQHFAGLGVGDVVGGDAPDDLFQGDRDLFHRGALHLLDGRLGDLASLFDDQLVVVAADVARCLEADQLIGLELLGNPAAVEEDRIGPVVVVEQSPRWSSRGRGAAPSRGTCGGDRCGHRGCRADRTQSRPTTRDRG